jgi:prokaryotic ubiquitin-like protein Pup
VTLAEQERKQSRRTDSTREEVAPEAAATPVGEELTNRIDDLLDEIDSVLEENAEEFVKNYVQKGGQ